MAWLRLHLFVVTALTLSGHVAVLTASSAVLYVLSPGTTGTSESCPLNLTADKSCSMTHCQMHRYSLNPDSTDSSNDRADVSHRDHQTVPVPSDNCRLRCENENLSPLTVFSSPGFLPRPLTMQPFVQITNLLTSSPSGYSDWTSELSAPPPQR